MLGQQSNNIYLNIIAGKIHRRVSSSVDNAIERTLKDGKVVHEQVFAYVEGLLDKIEMRDGDFGKQWMLYIEDGKEKYILQVNESSGYGDDLLTKIPALEKNRTYRIIPYEYTNKRDKKRSGLKIVYNDEQVNSCYHKFIQDGERWRVETTDKNYPKPMKEDMDSEEWKIYFMTVRKYLREKAISFLSTWENIRLDDYAEEPDEYLTITPDLTDDDLPF